MGSVEFIHELPFPSVVTDKLNKIVSYNQCFRREIANVAKNEMLDKLFERWELKHDDSIVFTEQNNRQYVFMTSNLQHNLKLYIGINNSFVNHVTHQLEELNTLNRELSAIFENSYDGIYITDPEGMTLKTNAAIERITGIPKEYYIGKKVDSLIKRGILIASVTHKVVKQRETVSLNQQNYLGKDTLLTGNPVFNEKGEVEKVVTNVRDLTDLNNLHIELKKVQNLNNQYEQELLKLKHMTKFDEGVVLISESMVNIYEMAERIANVDATVLILGETGVGKDVLARHIYHKSERVRQGEFVKVNCGAIPADLLESELFGYEAGAFTGASQKGKQGLFELAHHGVIFLDEIGELPLPLQVKLLRVLQENEIQRVGATKPKKIDVRVIAATNRNLKKLVEEGNFREDLYYRLNVIPIHVPPLRERRADILPMVQFFLSKINEKYAMNKDFDHELKEFFYNGSWKGNVRELANLIERLVLTVGKDLITIQDLPMEYRIKEESTFQMTQLVTLKQAVEMAEKRVLVLACETYKNTYEIADALETSQATIVRKLKKYRLKIE